MTIYDYTFNENEPIRQGDIFRNLPYISLDLLVKSTYKDDEPTSNQSEEIINKILRTGDIIQVETFISSTSAILASQDCEIRKDLDLYFFPLEEITSSTETGVIGYFDNNVRETIVKFYLPKLEHSKFDQKGPFHAKFRMPFTVPYNLIIKNIRRCWVARIKEPSRRFFVGKLTHFFSRPPIDEFIFAENHEIINYIKRKKAKANSEKKKLELLELVKDIKRVLKSAGRDEVLSQIPFDNLLNE